MIQKVEIPVNLPIKATNSVIIFSEPLTIIDPGVKGDITIQLFNDELMKIGKSLKDVKRIILTHGHIDHYGSVESIRKISDCKVFIHKYDDSKAKRKQRTNDEYEFKYKQMLIENGCGDNGINGMKVFFEFIKDMYDPLIETYHYDSNIDFIDLSLKVIYTPGHTRGSVVFYEPDSKLLISGDTIIKGISPNPVIEFTEDGERFNSQQSYINSLINLSKYEFSKIIGGHGEDITDFNSIFEKYKTEWDKKQSRLTDLFKENTELTAYEAMQLVFGELKDFQIFLGMSEMIGSFDYLESKGVIKLEKQNGVYKGKLALKGKQV